MKLSIAQIIRASTPSVMSELGRRYVLGPLIEGEGAYYYLLSDPITNHSIPMAWSKQDEDKTEDEKIKLVRDLLINAANVLDFMIELDEEYRDRNSLS